MTCGSAGIRECVFVLVLLAGVVVGEPSGSDERSVALEKITALGLADDSLSWQERPEHWLSQRRDRFRAELIAGLDDPAVRVAEGCLAILDGGQPTQEVREALARIAAQPSHLICAKATIGLCRYAGQKDVDSILQEALMDEARFADPRDRATVAEALGQKEKAAGLLVPLLDAPDSEYTKLQVIQGLGVIGDRSAVLPLVQISQGKEWRFTAAAYLALAEIAPQEHGLTADQKTFLKEGGRSFKANRPTYVDHWTKLAQLKRAEIRPYVLRMLASDTPSPALVILQLWRDKEALPHIRTAMVQARSWQLRDFATAYLDIEGTEASCEEVLNLPRIRQSDFELEYLVRAVAESIMPPERKLAVFRCIRSQFGREHPTCIPRSLVRAGDDMAFLLKSLMDEEIDIAALGSYAEVAGRDEAKRFTAGIRKALEALNGLEKIEPETAGPVHLILEAAAQYEIPEAAALTGRLLRHEPYEIRLPAAKVSAVLDGHRPEALRILNEALGSGDASVRTLASECLRSVSCRTDSERQQREEAVLRLLGTAQEDYALRVLITCAGPGTAARLTPMMDGEAIGRAVHAAWVLAQHPDETVRNRALRRIAIFAMFHHQVYQRGGGIDFPIAPGLDFHQVTQDLNPEPRQDAPPVRIPDELLTPFPWNEAERAFAIGAYRYTRLSNEMAYHHPAVFPWGWEQSGNWHPSHVALLQVIAREDPWIEPFHVQGVKIADFPNRRSAARIQAGITGRPVCFAGLEGEEVWTDALRTEPYDEQDAKVARHLLALIEASGPRQRPVGDADWRRLSLFNAMLGGLCESSRRGFGPSLKQHLLAEAEQRDLTHMLKQAGYEFWRHQAD